MGMAACAFKPVPSKLPEAGVKGLAGTMMSQVHPSPVFTTLVSARMSAALPVGRVAGRSPTGTAIGLGEQEDSRCCSCRWVIPHPSQIQLTPGSLVNGLTVFLGCRVKEIPCSRV